MTATDTPLRIYLAGPMRGIPAYNFPAFDAATEVLRTLGYEVFSPAERDRHLGFDPTGLTGNENLSDLGFDLRDALFTDLEFVTLTADAIVLLPGWRDSSGARAELFTAAALDLLAGEWPEGGLVPGSTYPWQPAKVLAEQLLGNLPALVAENVTLRRDLGRHCKQCELKGRRRFAIVGERGPEAVVPLARGGIVSSGRPIVVDGPPDYVIPRSEYERLGGTYLATPDDNTERGSRNPSPPDLAAAAKARFIEACRAGAPTGTYEETITFDRPVTADDIAELFGVPVDALGEPPAETIEQRHDDALARLNERMRSTLDALNTNGAYQWAAELVDAASNGDEFAADGVERESILDGIVGEVRVVDPTTGGEKGSKLARFDLVPVGPLTQLATLYGKGARKYADNNWRRGYAWSLSYAALMRHLTQWWGGEDVDAEMGLSHMAAVAWHAFTLMQFEVDHALHDDRPKVSSLIADLQATLAQERLDRHADEQAAGNDRSGFPYEQPTSSNGHARPTSDPFAIIAAIDDDHAAKGYL